jgi:type II secretory pathway component GspD/PulD (secretin)
VVPVPAGAPKVSTNVPPDSAAGLLEQSSDVLIFSGDQEQIDKLKAVLPDVDIPVPQVVARAVVYEVSASQTTGSGFQLALNFLGGKFGLSLGGQASATGNYAQIKTGTFDALIQSLDSDSHFKAISSPILRINSGSTGSFNVGDSVPTLGSISYPPNGGPAIQSVTYQQSGIIFTLSPTVFSDDVTLRLDQQISSFIPTSNGVNSSPTLTKRDLSTTVSMRSGQTIVLGGLSVSDVTRAKNGVPFLSSFFDTRSGAKTHQDVLLVLHIETLSPGAPDESASLSPGPILPSVGMLSSSVSLPSS